jgi:predicted MPP superfamily phosphohydrolase
MRWRWIAAIVLAAAAALVALGYRNARADPIVRRATIALPDWPAGGPPVTVALLADIHIESATMDARRLDRIVAQVNALHPDLIALAGDFVAGSDEEEAVRAAPLLTAALSRLEAPLGTVAVLGNHDHWTDPARVRAALDRAGILVLDNAAVARGPLAVGGVDDPFTGHARIAPTVEAMRRLRGAGVLIAHSPDAALGLPSGVHVVLAGHTHCGQIVLPIVGAPVEVADPRYRCGLIREPERTVVVTAGLGTTDLPLRFGAPPDVWLVTFTGSRRAAP